MAIFKTVKEHMDETDSIKKHIADSDALVLLLKSQLEESRHVLEKLRHFSPQNHFVVEAGYLLREKSEETLSMNGFIDREISRINKLLGDRA